MAQARRKGIANSRYINEFMKLNTSNSEPNFWLSCLVIDEDAMCRQVRGEQQALYVPEHGKSCPTEILETLASCNAEGRPIWKPMHMQPIFRMNPFITREGSGRAKTNAYLTVAENWVT